MDNEYKPFLRRSPEEYLQEIQNAKRGYLKLYVGAAPGVGKTYKMLQDAHDLRKDGLDIIIGYIETHGRKETIEQIKDLECIPLKKIHYKGKALEEVNIEEIIIRNPDIVLIDELAHSNVPGSKNKKRFEDVEEILAAGINVYCAMNIQHLESIHDLVQQVTGVAVRERVPDSFVRKANEMQLIDLTPEALQKRLQDGKIYKKEKIQQSMNNFFTITNLGSLRELALREVADDVDGRVLDALDENEKDGLLIKEKILVCVQYGSTAQKLIRRGWRMANRLNADLIVLTVKLENGDYNSPTRQATIREWKALTEQLGAVFIEEPSKGSKPADVIVNIAKKHNVTQILLGQSARSRFEEITKGSIVNLIMRKTKNIDLHIVSDNRN